MRLDHVHGPDARTLDATGGHRQPQEPGACGHPRRGSNMQSLRQCHARGPAAQPSTATRWPTRNGTVRCGSGQHPSWPDCQIRSQPPPVPVRPPCPFASRLLLGNGHIARPSPASVPRLSRTAWSHCGRSSGLSSPDRKSGGMPPSGPLPVRYQCATGPLPVTAIVTLATAKSCRFRPDGHQVDRLPPSASVSPGAGRLQRCA
jgi:hypothetical protein